MKIPPRQGAVLMEVALAVAVLGLVLAGGLMVAPAVVEHRRLTLTEARMDRVERALGASLLSLGVLPCPADALGPGEDWMPGSCPRREGAEATPSSLYTMGTLPWWTLGLMEEETRDGWGNRFTYGVSQSATDAGLPCGPHALDEPALRGAIIVLGTNKGREPPATEWATYVLISHGPNGLGAITEARVRKGVATNPSELENTPPNGVSQVRDSAAGARLHAAPGASDGEGFDDLPRVKTPGALLMALGCLEN
jgi:hypothetical protein